jgi:hypothetical protein
VFPASAVTTAMIMKLGEEVTLFQDGSTETRDVKLKHILFAHVNYHFLHGDDFNRRKCLAYLWVSNGRNIKVSFTIFVVTYWQPLEENLSLYKFISNSPQIISYDIIFAFSMFVSVQVVVGEMSALPV